MDPEDPTDAFLIAAVDYCTDTLGLDKDSLIKELADAVIGGYYPTPGQVFMDLLALSHLVYAGAGQEDPYIRLANETLRERYLALMDALGLEKDDGAANTRYYTLVDVYALAENRYGSAFLAWLRDEKTQIDLLNDLALRKGVVRMYGPGFNAPEGTVRISLANLNAEDYTEIARRLFELLDEYLEESGLGLADAA